MADNVKGTALITGASSGIGEVFARQLAAQGYDLILVARRADRLQALADDLRQQHSICAEILTGDLASSDDVTRVEQRIAAEPALVMLVNNAGFGTIGNFADVAAQKHVEMIAVHCTATTRLCRAALPGMIQRKQGAIINVSSFAGLLPLRVTYAATKAYLITFSEALQLELRGTGVQVQALCPGFTYTGFHDTPEYAGRNQRARVPKPLWLSADDVVRTSLNALGSGRVIVVPGLVYKLIAILAHSALAPILARSLAGRM